MVVLSFEIAQFGMAACLTIGIQTTVFLGFEAILSMLYLLR